MIVLNGERTDLVAGTPLADAIERLGLSLDARGVAVAVDGQVLPRSEWQSYRLAEETRVEVLTAMQGG
ncbi:MAG TPA: sulfur carrier protein ThiS [Solirubrobacteraceae bacterium]|jgi:sulfur carrier protein